MTDWTKKKGRRNPSDHNRIETSKNKKKKVELWHVNEPFKCPARQGELRMRFLPPYKEKGRKKEENALKIIKLKADSIVCSSSNSVQLLS